jgi:hypothetical protein
MPPRYSYWTILAGGLPTAFRAAERADLLPTFNRIREKHPDAEMKWFARGKLWESPEASLADLQRARTRRDRDWRPGGDHRDPRQAFKTKRKHDSARRDQPAQPSSSKPPPADPRPARPAAKPGGPHARTARPPSKFDRPYTRTARHPSKPGSPHMRSPRPPKRRPR